ncbi:MAG: hypothetical protein MZW92_53640 [Comamonadaceae bacterium]|nr:hypothetical protein [Comamonadaceae bacterium]
MSEPRRRCSARGRTSRPASCAACSRRTASTSAWRRTSPHAVFPLTVNGLGEVRIAVSGDDAEAATRLIQRLPGDRRGRALPARIRDEFEALQEAAGYRFRDRGILEHALTHRSRANEDVDRRRDRQRVARVPRRRGARLRRWPSSCSRDFPDRDEGQKSKMKAALVSTPALARQASRPRPGRAPAARPGRGEDRRPARSARCWPTATRRSSPPSISTGAWTRRGRSSCASSSRLSSDVRRRGDHRRRPQVGAAGDCCRAAATRCPSTSWHGRRGPGAPPAVPGRSPRARRACWPRPKAARKKDAEQEAARKALEGLSAE